MASEGIYYVVRYPKGWELVTMRFGKGMDANHCDWWETNLAVPLAAKWAKHLGVDSTTLERDLPLLPYGFPRGRISKVGRRFVAFQSGDTTPSMGISQEAIEEAFGIKGRCSWQFDEHEQCTTEDKAEIQRILKIPEDWKAI